MNRVISSPSIDLADVIAAYASDFELIRIGMRAACKRSNPDERLEQLWTAVYRAAPGACAEMSDLIVAHRRACGTFRDLCQHKESSATAVLAFARAAHYAALAALCRKIGTAAQASDRRKA